MKSLIFMVAILVSVPSLNSSIWEDGTKEISKTEFFLEFHKWVPIYPHLENGFVSFGDESLDKICREFKIKRAKFLFLIVGGAIVERAFIIFVDQGDIKDAMRAFKDHTWVKHAELMPMVKPKVYTAEDRKSTRLNSSH